MNRDFVNRMLVWYNAAGRDLPWRHTRDPYRIWISEVMLQQTRVETVKVYYQRFLAALPGVRDLAECPEEQVLKLWEGLGYYSRARNLKRAAEMIMREYGGVFPENPADIRHLPGIGSYTAGAVSSIAFGCREPAVDGNVLRVYARLFGIRDNILDAKTRKKAERDIRDIMKELPEDSGPEDNAAGAFNQSLIELGALLCIPNGDPRCGECPVSGSCAAYRDGTAGELPVRIGKTEKRIEDITVLLIRSGGLTAIRRRPEKGLLAGLYEFPNLAGHLSAAEASGAVSEMGFRVKSVRRLPDARHVFSHVIWRMTGYEIVTDPQERTESGRQVRSVEKLLFVSAGEMNDLYAVPSAFAAYKNCLAREKEQEYEDFNGGNSVL